LKYAVQNEKRRHKQQMRDERGQIVVLFEFHHGRPRLIPHHHFAAFLKQRCQNSTRDRATAG
jgi:hypothetical protein